MITTSKHIVARPHTLYIEALQLVAQAIKEDPVSVEVQHIDGLLSPEEIWSEAVLIPYRAYKDVSSGEDDFVIGIEWGPRDGVRWGNVFVRINPLKYQIEILTHHHHCAVGLLVAGYNIHQIQKDPMIEYLTAVNQAELVTLILLLIKDPEELPA